MLCPTELVLQPNRGGGLDNVLYGEAPPAGSNPYPLIHYFLQNDNPFIYLEQNYTPFLYLKDKPKQSNFP